MGHCRREECRWNFVVVAWSEEMDVATLTSCFFSCKNWSTFWYMLRYRSLIYLSEELDIYEDRRLSPPSIIEIFFILLARPFSSCLQSSMRNRSLIIYSSCMKSGLSLVCHLSIIKSRHFMLSESVAGESSITARFKVSYSAR